MKYSNSGVVRLLPLSGLLCIVLASFSLTEKDGGLLIKTHAGLVSGTTNQEGNVHIFKGIPFAAPPVGGLRWKAPQPVLPWKGVRKCDVFGASAMQRDPVPFMMYSSEFLIPWKPISEDCLYLNVWTKMRTGAEKMPVIVWIHGGGFNSGSGSCPIYDGENMAKKGVVFVTINYRLGVFGFLAHPELTKESPDHASGNYAFLDQIAALKWVQANIAAFDGDPDRVTIAGQSAGAFSVNVLMASPQAKGLFRGVIAESGGIFSSETGGLPLQTAEQNGEQLMKTLHAGSIADMRAMPADSLFMHSGSFRISPVVDGYVLPENVHSLFEQGRQNDVPVLTGWNGDDGFSLPMHPSPEEYKTDAVKRYGPRAARFMDAFPGGSTAEIKKSQAALARDMIFAWQNYTWAKLETTKGRHPAYLYVFNRTPPGEEQYGAFHSAEITYAYHSLQMWNRLWTVGDRKLEDMMSSYWANFAAKGDPNADGLPVWDRFDPDAGRIMALDVPEVSMKPMASRAELDFLDSEDSLRRSR